MQEINQAEVRQWRREADRWAPRSINTVCPHCGVKVTFSLDRFQYYANCQSISSMSSCPHCGGEPSFWTMKCGRYDDKDATKCEAIFMYPSARQTRQPILTDLDEMPEAVLADYKSAVNVFNIGEWNASAVCCRRVMEGLTHHLLPEEYHKKTLADQLKVLPGKVELAKPILMLADAIREGGNWGAHFRAAGTPDPTSVALMLDFVEYFLEYVYALPHRVARLQTKIKDWKGS